MIFYINIHTHNPTKENVVGVFNLLYNDIADSKLCSFGMHPWDLDKYSTDKYLTKLEQYCIENKIIAVGEIGIDKAINHPLDNQIEIFKKQILLAEKYKLPVIIHCVKAWSNLINLQIKLKPNMVWIFHGYNGSLEIASQLINNGCYLSFGHLLLKNNKIQTVFKSIPLDKIFLETDNSHEKIENIYKKAADLRHICIDKLKEQIESNFRCVFGTVNI